MRLWTWALEAYARPNVAAACLSLQDAHGQNVPYLLWAAWAAAEGRVADLAAAARLVRRWDAEVGAPLRGVRRALKPDQPPVDPTGREALRDAVKTVELQGERVLMETLEAMSGPPGERADLAAGLIAAAHALGDPPREAALVRLADALG